MLALLDSLLLKEVVVEAKRDSILLENVHLTKDMRNSLRRFSSSMFRELGNRFVFSIRGLEDKQNQGYLEGINMNHPVWGYIPTNAIVEHLVEEVRIAPNAYSYELYLSEKRVLGFQVGSFGRKGIFVNTNIEKSWIGMEVQKDENTYPYKDRFGRLYVRRNNHLYRNTFYFKSGSTFLLAYSSDIGMPRRGYGSEGSDKESYQGIMLSVRSFKLHAFRYRYNLYPYMYALWTSLSVGSFLSELELHREYFKLSFMRNGLGLAFMKGRILPRYELRMYRTKQGFFMEMVFKNRLPNFSELYYRSSFAEGNPSLESEYLNTINLGYMNSKMKLGVFYTLMINPILWLPDKDVWKAQNRRYLILYGVEGNLDLEHVSIGFAYVRNSLDGKMVLPYRPNFIANASFKFKSVFLENELEIAYYHERPSYYNEDSYRMEPILLINYWISYEGSFFLRIGLKNLLNESWEFIEGYPTEPFSLDVKGGLLW